MFKYNYTALDRHLSRKSRSNVYNQILSIAFGVVENVTTTKISSAPSTRVYFIRINILVVHMFSRSLRVRRSISI